VPEMAGASVFIGTTLFKSLENGLPLIQETIEASNDNDFRDEIHLFWNAFSKLFFTLGIQDRYSKSEQVDFAFNLLYLASGIAYHRVAEWSSKMPIFDERLIGVEPFDDLLKICRWPKKTESVKLVFDSLIVQMMACKKDFKCGNQ
jgi:hypothetical protein